MIEYTDQQFLYRAVPVDYDGAAKLKRIKGNTLAFNQLAPTLASGNYSANRSTIAYSNNVATVTTNGNDGFGFYRSMATVVGHEYLFTAKVKPSKVGSLRLGLDEDSTAGNRTAFSSTAEKTVSRTWTCATANSPLVCYYYNNAIASGDNYTITNLMVIDLTLMGITADQFKSYFPLPYYSYQSTLLPFKGTGIKTVGKNLLPKMTSSVANGITWTVNDDGTVVANGTASADSKLTVEFTLLEGNYYFNGCPDGGNDGSTWNCYMWDLTTGTRAKQWDKTSNVLNNTNSTQSRQFYSNGTNRYAYNCRVMIGQTVSNLVFKPMVRLSSADDVYEPYTSSTTNLPTSTYFPNGMKSAGSVYDELTETKAITRVGSRAYQSGDENNANYVTDGTTTYYPLATETETDADAEIFYRFYQYGTEQILPVNGATPTTAPIIADIEYYNQIESETPYRKFWLVNGNGERWDLTEKELKSFLENPQGLGFQKTIDVTRYGERAYKNTESYNFPQVTGDVLFYDSANSTRYEKYNEFVRFLMEQPITLHYMIPVSYNSLIADTYSLECEVMSLTKTESKTDRILTSNIQMNGLGFYEGDEIEINGTANTLTINNKGDFPVGFEIELRGTYKNPYFTLEQNGELYGEAKFDDNANNFSSVFVNSKDGEQNVVLKQNNSIMPNPLAYQDLSISNGSIYVTFVKLAKGESTLTIGADSYTISGYTIRYTPIYRSV